MRDSLVSQCKLKVAVVYFNLVISYCFSSTMLGISNDEVPDRIKIVKLFGMFYNTIVSLHYLLNTRTFL